MDNFNLKSYLLENKLTRGAKLINEISSPQEIEDAIKKATEAQEELLKLLSSVPPSDRKRYEDSYKKTMKIRKFIYPGLFKEASEVSDTMYYAVINYNNEPMYYLKTKTKEDMVNKLNSAFKDLTGTNYVPYTIEDMEDNIYMGKKMDHFISDDWASVTDNVKVFEKDFKASKNYLKTPPQEYKA